MKSKDEYIESLESRIAELEAMNIDELVPMKDIKLSKHDKNLVAMCWLAEIILLSLTDCCKDLDKNAPDEKKQMYQAIASRFIEPYKIAQELNSLFDEQIKKVFDDEFQDTLCDLTLAIVDLYETMKPSELLRIIKSSRIKR